MTVRTAFMFPGQGSYIPGALHRLINEFPAAQAVLDQIDEVCAELDHAPVSRLLVDPGAPSLDDLVADQSADLDAALFASNIVTYQILVSIGRHADVVLGHSLGEVSAFTAAGALTVPDATRLVFSRTTALQSNSIPSGGMLALSIGSHRAAHLVDFVAEPRVAVAVDNGPEQCVVSGPDAGLTDVERIAAAVGIRATRLRAIQPFHNRLLLDAADDLSRAFADIPVAEPRIPVYSPVLGRYVGSADDIRSWVGGHLTRPVLFYDALLRLYRDGVRCFLESGGRNTLTRMVPACLPAAADTVTPLRRRCSAAEFRQAVESAASGPPDSGAVDAAPKRADTDGGTSNGKQAASFVPVPVAVPESSTEPKRTAPEQSTEPDRSATPDHSATPESDAAEAQTTGLPGTADLVARIREIYADTLGYPAEMLDADVDLEADLGIDSIKQIEAFRLVRQQFGLPEPSAEIRVTSYSTLAEVAELLRSLADQDGAAVAHDEGVPR
ncbi:acyltransferase domain-containing protein [Nocardia sp. XZ_19_369]|uniref:acyltransferase domain-containing protein n=1 Tax=Nocardia sp. XZ_19_369 TaxID=2769487 RepID=UPI00188F45F6|nr:acyltransferase domain-containing protein [Nocardia sp. XZ_19_369]